MNIEHYQNFKVFEDKGLKKEAAESIRSFISSFENEEEIDGWVWENISNLSINRSARIRHEIFHQLVFPILKTGYLNKDFNCTLWLGKLIQNIYQYPKAHEELGWVTEIELFKKCHELNPENDEARKLLLSRIVSWLEYTEHEWPSGILYGNNGATLEQCSDIASEIELILSLDEEHKYNEFIKQYSKKLAQYKARLNKAI